MVLAQKYGFVCMRLHKGVFDLHKFSVCVYADVRVYV